MRNRDKVPKHCCESSEDAAPAVSLSARKLKLVVNISDSKENEIRTK